MTYIEYTKKRNNIASSEASVDVKAKAIEDLDNKFYRRPSDEARKQIEESAPDPIKPGEKLMSELYKVVCNNCDSEERFTSVPLEWRCDTCDHVNGYSNKNLIGSHNTNVGNLISAGVSPEEAIESTGISSTDNFGEFKKLDIGKNRLSLIEPIFIENIGKILTMGAEKYGVDNWKTLPDEELYRYQDALLRHINAYFKGESVDSETNLSHLYHAACNLMFLDYFDRQSK